MPILLLLVESETSLHNYHMTQVGIQGKNMFIAYLIRSHNDEQSLSNTPCLLLVDSVKNLHDCHMTQHFRDYCSSLINMLIDTFFTFMASQESIALLLL